jgi:hypothetical protein
MADPPLLHDRYRLVRRLGSGTFATVYLAEDTKMGRLVAVKVVEKARDLEGRALREAQAAAKLSHPHIVTVYEVTQEHDRTLLFTEYIEGATLRELYSKEQLSDGDILHVGIQACRALEHAHKRGVIHRDIKPENVMLVGGEGVDVRIMDFGVARLEDLTSITVDGQLLGTLAYMAPEQLDGQTVTPRADVYSLALTLYEGFSGVNPYRGKDAAALLRGSAVVSLPRLTRLRPELPGVLAEALEQGLEVDPGLRPDAAGLRRLLERAGRGLPEPQEEPTLTARTVEALAPLAHRPRVAYVARRLVAGACALATTAYLLPRVPFYPESWIFVLVVLASFVALLVPTAGAGFVILLLAPPIFAFAPGWGLLYLPLALLVFALMTWRGRSWAVLLPGAVPFLVVAHVGLAVPALSGVFYRRWGPLGGLLGGLSLAIAAGMQGWNPLPYTFSPGPGPVLLSTRHMTMPGDVLVELARFFDSYPELLLQMVLFAVFAVPLTLFFKPDPVLRLWAAAAYLAGFLGALALLPPLLLGVPVDATPLLVALVPCAIIVILCALLSSSERPLAALEG